MNDPNGFNTVRMARVGVLFDRAVAERMHGSGRNTFEVYIGEILAHAGLRYQWLDDGGQITRRACDVAIVALAPDDASVAEQLWQFAAQGGGVILLANQPALAERAGWTVQAPMGTGYASLPGMPPLRFLRAVPALVEGSAETKADGTLFEARPDG